MRFHGISASTPAKQSHTGSIKPPQVGLSKTENTSIPDSNSDEGEPPASTSKIHMNQPLASPIDAESYFSSFNSYRSSRANSIYSLSRISLSSQLSQLTSLALPNASSLSISISSIQTAPAAATTLSIAAEQIRKWLQKASEVLNGLDAEDDVEWAAAGGREGLGELDAAIGKFERLVNVYVKAIDDLQKRDDIHKVHTEQQKAVVDQMESILKNWENVRKSLKSIKAQVELAMEWEELWNVVLGDIGLEMENLSRLVFEMEEARHTALLSDTVLDGNNGLDIQELDTIVEEAPIYESKIISHRFSLTNRFQASSPMTSPGLGISQDDTTLLALFARMQPLRASLDFLPMTLSSFQTRAESVLPTACQDLESRRKTLEKKWKNLESDAEGLRRELGEDQWIIAFRNAGRKAQKLCESVERSLSKLQESIDVGTQHSNPPQLAKNMDGYESKKRHYAPAIKRVLAIIEKGAAERSTINGEILRLHSDMKGRWQNLEIDMKGMDLALDDLTTNKNQQLRDSISSIVSMDRSATGSAVETPGSSPASSVMAGPTNGHKRDQSPAMNGSSRRSSVVSTSTSRPNGSRRYFSMPPGSANLTQLPRKTPVSRSFTSDISRSASPSPYANSSSTPTPGSRPERLYAPADSRPRWNSSPRVDYFDLRHKSKPLPFSTPPQGRKSSLSFRSPSSAASHASTGHPLPSALGRSSPAPSPASTTLPPQRNRNSYAAQSSLGNRRSFIAPTDLDGWVKVKDKTPPSSSRSRPQNIRLDSSPSTAAEDTPSARPHPQRPSTAMASNRRSSMLPVPKESPSPFASFSGRESVMATRGRGNESSLGPQGR